MPDLSPNYLIYRNRVCVHPSCCNPVRALANTKVSAGRAIAINSRLWPASGTETCQVSQAEREIHAPVLSAPLAAFAAASLLFAQGPLLVRWWPQTCWSTTCNLWALKLCRAVADPHGGQDDEKPPLGPKWPTVEGLSSCPVMCLGTWLWRP